MLQRDPCEEIGDRRDLLLGMHLDPSAPSSTSRLLGVLKQRRDTRLILQ